jgi:hypothetical protein
MIKRLSIIILLAIFFTTQSVGAGGEPKKLIKFTKTYAMYSYYDDSIVLLSPRKQGLNISFLSRGSTA